MNTRILYIHSEQKLKYGAHYINDTIIRELRKQGNLVDTIYPQESINLLSRSLSGISNILFFFSLMDKRKTAKKYDFIQGTTYTTLPFLDLGIPTISHFGSTTVGFLKSVPSLNLLRKENEMLGTIFQEIQKSLGINNFNSSIKAIGDISKIELHVAKKSTVVIATSERVKKELMRNGVQKNRIEVVHNAIEDYWFSNKLVKKVKRNASIVYLGRMGDDGFTIKLKGISRLVYILRKFPQSKKVVIGMCQKTNQYQLFFSKIKNTQTYLSLEKKKIPAILQKHYGDIYINTGRYEGFCLSLIEAMSQGLIPIVFPIGVVEEIIENGMNGFIVKDLEEMIEKINLVKNHPNERKRMAQNAVKTAMDFTPKIMIEKLKSIYRQVKTKTRQ